MRPPPRGEKRDTRCSCPTSCTRPRKQRTEWTYTDRSPTTEAASRLRIKHKQRARMRQLFEQSVCYDVADVQRLTIQSSNSLSFPHFCERRQRSSSFQES